MSSRRCSVCDLELPTTDAFKTCPKCAGETWFHRNGRPNQSVNHRGKLAPHEIDREVREFRRWLDTVTADDFRLAT